LRYAQRATKRREELPNAQDARASSYAFDNSAQPHGLERGKGKGAKAFAHSKSNMRQKIERPIRPNFFFGHIFLAEKIWAAARREIRRSLRTPCQTKRTRGPQPQAIIGSGPSGCSTSRAGYANRGTRQLHRKIQQKS